MSSVDPTTARTTPRAATLKRVRPAFRLALTLPASTFAYAAVLAVAFLAPPPAYAWDPFEDPPGVVEQVPGMADRLPKGAPAYESLPRSAWRGAKWDTNLQALMREYQDAGIDPKYWPEDLRRLGGYGTSAGAEPPSPLEISLPNPIIANVPAAVVIVLGSATTLNAQGDIYSVADEQLIRNRVALRRFLRQEALRKACSDSGGTPVTTPGGTHCIPNSTAPVPPPTQGCDKGNKTNPDGTCASPDNGGGNDHGGLGGRPNNDNNTDPWDDQECWQEDGWWKCL